MKEAKVLPVHAVNLVAISGNTTYWVEHIDLDSLYRKPVVQSTMKGFDQLCDKLIVPVGKYGILETLLYQMMSTSSYISQY